MVKLVYLKKYNMRFSSITLLGFIFFISCKNKNLYYKNDLEVYKTISTNNKKYFIFKPALESSLNWPYDVEIQFNFDSTQAKLFIKKYHSLSDDNKSATNSNINLVRDFPDLNLSYQDIKDSLQKSMFYVVILPNATLNVELP